MSPGLQLQRCRRTRALADIPTSSCMRWKSSSQDKQPIRLTWSPKSERESLIAHASVRYNAWTPSADDFRVPIPHQVLCEDGGKSEVQSKMTDFRQWRDVHSILVWIIRT